MVPPCTFRRPLSPAKHLLNRDRSRLVGRASRGPPIAVCRENPCIYTSQSENLLKPPSDCIPMRRMVRPFVREEELSWLLSPESKICPERRYDTESVVRRVGTNRNRFDSLPPAMMFRQTHRSEGHPVPRLREVSVIIRQVCDRTNPLCSEDTKECCQLQGKRLPVQHPIITQIPDKGNKGPHIPYVSILR